MTASPTLSCGVISVMATRWLSTRTCSISRYEPTCFPFRTSSTGWQPGVQARLDIIDATFMDTRFRMRVLSMKLASSTQRLCLCIPKMCCFSSSLMRYGFLGQYQVVLPRPRISQDAASSPSSCSVPLIFRVAFTYSSLEVMGLLPWVST